MTHVAGPGGPYSRGEHVVDATAAVLLDDITVVMVGAVDSSGVAARVGLELGGRINKSTRRSSTLYLMDSDGAAAIIAELIGLANRAGGDYLAELHDRLDDLP